MMLAHLALAAAVGLMSGLSIGCIGVGGVIIVPLLVQLGGVPVHAAIAAAMAGYILTGLVGSAVFLRHGTLGWRSALPTLMAAMPAAALGALAARAAPATMLQLLIGILTAASGLQMMLRKARAAGLARTTPLTPPLGACVGALTGFLSALTGTGGPAVLLPTLLWLEVPVLAALGLAQAIQLPIATLATLGNVLGGSVSWALALPLGAGLALGTWMGARAAHALDQALLRRLVALMLLGVGLLMLGRVAFRLA